jgi:hypothetical protein
MSENTMITEKKKPNPQKVKWYNVAYYDNYQQANEHRNNLDGLVKVRRCGEYGTKFVVKSGTPIEARQDEE